MSLFGSRTKHIYTPYSMLLYENVAGIIKQTIGSSVLYNRNMGKDLIANIANGILYRANSYYAQAKQPNHPWGLPDGAASRVLPSTRSQLQAVIEKEVGHKIAMHTAHIEIIPTGGAEYAVSYWKVVEDKLTGSELYWKYNTNLNTYPQLAIKAKTQESPYYPITPIRIEGKNIAERGMADRRVVKNALSKLSLKVDDLYKGFEDAIKENPDTEIAEDVFILLAVSIASKKQESQDYLFRFFQQMAGLYPNSENEYAYSQNQKNEFHPNQCRLEIKDSRFHQVLEWDFIRDEVVNGLVDPKAKVGTCKVKYIAGIDGPISPTLTQSTHVVQISKQVSKTQYIQLTIKGLICQTLVIGKSWETVTLKDAFDNPESPEDGQCFLVPLRRDIVAEMGNIKGHDLIYDTIRMYSNDHYSYKLKWYQTGLFKVLLTIVAVVVSIMYPPAGVVAWSALAVANALINLVIAMILVPLVTKLVENVLGEELALLVAVLAAAYAGSLDVSSISNAVTSGASLASIASTITSQLGVTTISAINAGVLAIGGAYNIYANNTIAEIAQMREELQKEIEAYDEAELSNAYNVNATYNRISSDPYQLMEPSSYVRRALMEPQVPTYTAQMTENFVRVKQYLDTSRTALYLGH